MPSRPTDRKYMPSHEWCKIEGTTATIGITDYAVSHLSDLVFLDLPAKGAKVTADESFGQIESVKAVSDLFAPVSGEVIETNSTLPDNLELLSQDPMGKAWMIKVKFTAQSKQLMDAGSYQKHVEAEAH
jgi:glycine cleavage system H protein